MPKEPYVFDIRAIKDLDKNGRTEIFGAFKSPTKIGHPIPVVVFWDDSEARYRIEPLLREPPDLVRLPKAAREQTGKTATLRRVYATPIRLVDKAGGISVTAHPVEAFGISRRAGSSRLLAAFSALAPAEATSTHLWQLIAFKFRFDAAAPAVLFPCQLYDRKGRRTPLIIEPPTDFDDVEYLAREWNRNGSDAIC